MKLSVVIPIYKSESTLNRCVDSVLRQGIIDMEIILVDDGSPDSSPAMCDALAEKDSRIKVIHKENGGPSDARNAGIECATGEFITFVDSDDYLNENVYIPLVEQFSSNPQIDIIEYSINCVGFCRTHTKYSNRIYTSARDYWKQTHAWAHSYMCNKIYRRRLFDDTRLRVGSYYEDLFLLPYILLKQPVVATSDLVGYNYCISDKSITAAPGCGNTKQLLAAELQAAKLMHANWYSRYEWHLYYCMLLRQFDIYRLSEEIILKWPFIRLICWLHKTMKQLICTIQKRK